MLTIIFLAITGVFYTFQWFELIELKWGKKKVGKLEVICLMTIPYYIVFYFIKKYK